MEGLVVNVIALRRWIKSERGQSMVELAIILPVLLLLIFGMVEFGRILACYLVMENLARDAARYGVVGHDDQEVRDLVTAQNPMLDRTRLNVEIVPSGGDRSHGDALTVTLVYGVKIISPIFSGILPNPFPLSAACTMMVE